MGISSTEALPHAAAGFFFCPPTGRVLLHQRDGKTDINPHKWAFFTGLVEGDESPLQAFIREISEEIGYRVTFQQMHAFDTYLNKERQTIRHVFVAEVAEEFLPRIVHEGAGVGWFTLEAALQLDSTRLTERDLKKFSKSEHIKST
jgi:8-oxo-dGTP pyrophosphatase MutT (NUDIX family)